MTLDASRRFLGDLLDEYLALFPGRWWHTGADEYLGIASTEADYEAVYPQLSAYARARYGAGANGKDAVLDFINWVARRCSQPAGTTRSSRTGSRAARP